MDLGARRLVVGCLVVVAGLIAAASPSGASVGPRVVGGGVASITEHPWQVAIVVKDEVTPTSAVAAQFCGGVIVDAMHVITAAHCLDLDENDAVDPVANRQVMAGAGDLGALGAGGGAVGGRRLVGLAGRLRPPELPEPGRRGARDPR